MMELNGHEINMRYTVRARIEISSLLPNGKMDTFFDMIEKPEAESVEFIIKVTRILNREYEKAMALERGEKIDPEKEYCQFTEDDFYGMNGVDFLGLAADIIRCVQSDSKTLIEAKEPKGSKGKKTKAEAQ